ncbi:uncharacterized protein LOC128998828 [Macrosteles quadrilineatus]|uniref:uncharacterized protein LOC128998828 n=1 Tax=Macrosteles quadrilineatus TaxID=74068 RepID=UPI0023E25292|nr:uncharacterized protein LOC128998828 [Macrosteles quadrilineatus]
MRSHPVVGNLTKNADSIDKLTAGQVVKALFYDATFSEPVSQSVSRMSTAPRLIGKAESGDSVVDSLLKSSHQFRIYEVPDVKQHVPIVFFSSGTTGTPKGIEVSDFHVQLSGILFESRRESLLIASPLYWYSALGTLMSAIHQNHSMIITNSNDARYRLKLMEKYKVESFFSNMANMIQYINEPMFEDFDLSSVKTVLVEASGAYIAQRL